MADRLEPGAAPAFLYLPALPGPGSHVELPPDAAHYVARVCRGRVGESVEATDGQGALLALKAAGVEVKGRKVLLMGAGGAARAIAYAFAREGARISIANRSPRRASELASRVGGAGHGLDELTSLVPSADVVINATSVGMKEGDPRLFEGGLLHKDQAVFDIVYNRETELLKDARTAGAVAVDGVMMLVHQGAKALEIWTGKRAPVEVMERAVREGLRARR